jgi:hypothetical protein
MPAPVRKDAADKQKRGRKSMRYDGFSVRKPPGKKHRDLFLVAAVLFTEFGDEILLFKDCPENDPEGPEDVEKQTVRMNVRGRPDENQDEKIARMTNPAIGSADNQFR